MNEKFKILTNFIKDMSSETPDVESYLFVKENISKYNLNINITSKPLKNKMIEVSTILKFEDKSLNEKRSNFEIVYISIIKIDSKIDHGPIICETKFKNINTHDIFQIQKKANKLFLNLTLKAIKIIK